MYDLVLFTGGVYQFDKFEEFIDDIGGLIIEMESFKINRGMYFLSEEMRVLTLIPEIELSEVKNLANDIKGMIEPVEMLDNELEKVILIFEIYKIFKIFESMNFKTILKHLSNDPDFVKVKNFKIQNPHKQKNFTEKIEKLLVMMEDMNLIEKIQNKDLLYKIALKNSEK
jgi:hypothetical protein